MPDYIVLRLTPAAAIDATTFKGYLAGLTVKAYDISCDNPSGQVAPALLAITGASVTGPKVTLKNSANSFGTSVSVGDPILVQGVGTGYDGVFVCIAPTNAGTITYQATAPFAPTPATGQDKVQPHVIGVAKYNTSIVQHVDLAHPATLESVATAVIPVPAGIPQYVSPSIQIEFDRTGFQPVLNPEIYHEVVLLSAATAPTPYQTIPASSVSAYVTLPAPLSNTAAAPLQLQNNGNPPNYDDLLTAVTAVLAKDPGPTAQPPAKIDALTLDQCRNIAFEIVYGQQPPLPAPPLSPNYLEDMYTSATNDGSASNPYQQALSAFQGSLTSYYAQNDAAAMQLTNFVFSLSAALACEQLGKLAGSAMLNFPVNPNPSTPPINATVSEAEVILTGIAGTVDVPAPYFYALCAQLPAQIPAAQRFAMTTAADQQDNLAQLTDAVNAGWITIPPGAMNPVQAVRAMNVLVIPATSTATRCDITLAPTNSVAQIWKDWLAYPTTAWPGFSKLPATYTFQPGDDIEYFWPNEATAQSAAFLDLVLCVLTQGWPVASPPSPFSPNTSLATIIKANLKIGGPSGPPIANVGGPGPCLANALPSDWQTFFGPPPSNAILVNLLPSFTQGNSAARLAAFIRYFQSLFGVQSVTPSITPSTPTPPPGLSLPAGDLIKAAIGSLKFGQFANIGNASVGDAQANAWAVQAINTVNDLAGLTGPTVPPNLQFSVMEALYARGFTSAEDILELPSDDFQQALAGTVAYDFALAIYGKAGAPHNPPATGAQTFTPINPGSLTDCVPPLYLSPLGPIAYLQEMLKVSEGSTCDDPFPAAQIDVQPQNLAAVIAQRRGPIATTMLATRGNLDTPLPLIDIVNECLEYVASTKPLGTHGAVYNTAEDLLAVHRLCAEACCAGQEKHHDAECHDPATLFAALPEYSTPGIPPSGAPVPPAAGALPSAPVEPAVYNILKADFSSCCLPYAQALDVSRTYLEYFGSCRFEVMRTFRKCITEFVLDPGKPPAGFRSYLWRYPVRIDIAIEYLGITPEEYVMLFGGVWPDVCAPHCQTPAPHATLPAVPAWQLYGFGPRDETWTATAVQLPEFLKRTCLTYCEFIDLWKCGPVKFGNADDRDGPFPDCEPCCLDKLQLKFPELQGKPETSLYLLAIFIRLWHKLKRLCGGGYSFQQLTDICTVLPLFNGVTVDPDFIRQLAAFEMLRDQLRLPLTDEGAKIAPGAGGADRTFLLSLWAGTGHQWDWALQRFIEGIAHYAACRYGCQRREPEFLKHLVDELDCLSQLAGFDPATAGATWHAKPTHTLRFAEILAKIYASHFSIGEILFLFAGDDRLCGEHGYGLAHEDEHKDGYGRPRDDKPEHDYGHPREDESEHGYGHTHEDGHGRDYGRPHEGGSEHGYGHDHEHGYDHDHDHGHEDEHDHEHGHREREDHERRPSPWQLRRKLLERHVRREETADWTWSRLESALQHEFGLAGEHPSAQRRQAMFDCWERIFDYDRVRKENWRDCGHLRFFQDQSVAVYELTTDDLEDERWMVRIANVERWIASPSRCVEAKAVARARPDLWASDDPAALVAGETEPGNTNLSRFLGDACIEAGAQRRYTDLKKLNDGLRERGRCALVAYICGVNGITPKELSKQLLLDVETGLCEKASRIEEAITAVQTFIQQCRIGLEGGWIVHPQFAHMWDSRFANYHVWQKCKLRELYKENWIDWHELEKASKIESFRFMDEELRRVSLTIAAPGGVDYWPEQRPPAPGLCLLQDRDLATMQSLPAPRQGLGLLATPERGARPSWVTTVPQQKPGQVPDLPLWMEAAIKLGTKFVRVAAAGYPPASTHFEPRKSRPAGTTEESCVECCAECGCRHPAHVDEYYFWLVDGRHFDPHSQPVYNNFDAQQNAYYDQAHQVSTPWHDPAQLATLLEWPSKPMVRLAWCRVHNGEFRQPRISDGGIDVSASTGTPDLIFQGRSGDSLFFQVTNILPTPGFRYDLADDLARAHDNMVFPPPPPAVLPTGGLYAYPYFAYFAPGARLFPWSPYSPAIAVANALRAHCRFEAALKWYDRYYDPLAHDNTWTKCLHDDPSHPSSQTQPPSQPTSAPPATAAATATPGVVTPAVTGPAVPVAAPPAANTTPAVAVVATPAIPATPAVAGATAPPVTATPAAPAAAAPAGTAPIGTPANTVTTTCCDSTEVSCHVARQRSVLLHYLETLVEWGDALMRRDSPEQFQQARVIFDGARRILGRPPHKVRNPAPVSPTAATVATFVPLFAPINPRLMTLYDRIDDRMALIHHCLGARRLRQASERRDAQYWGHDPVRDGWRGDPDRCCEEGDWCHPHSPYRFTFLVQKAKELANQTRELGGALLAAFEKGDAEYLASMRAVHERELLALGRKVREGEWRDADFQVQALQKTKESDQASRLYYANLIANGLISHENGYVTQTNVALIERTASNALELIGQLMVTTPDVFSPTSVGVTNQLPVGNKLQGKFTAAARILTTLADIASTKASLDLTKAGWDRRLQDWVHQVVILDIQIEQVELQILGAERRRHDSLLQLNNQQRQIEQSSEVMNFLRDKFTNHAVYLFLQKNTADLHYKMYELALSAAREAERAFHFERGHDTGKFVCCEGWDSLHEGLLAGERLQLSLAQMEKQYCDRNRREYELTKHVSLRLQFPVEFLRLKLTGRCEIDLAEWRFDQDYPGHFMRRIKNATLTIPSVSGPYNGVHCRLTLLGSATRVNPLLSLAPAQCCDKCRSGNGYEACPHDPRVVRHYAATEAIATSSGQNDSGLFELNFHDDRYLPFEFHGAASKWRIELPPENNYFDMDTLSDVILHLNYTAREGGERLRQAAQEAAERRLPGAGWCLFDIPHDFPDAWELFRTSHGGKQHLDERRGERRPRHLDLKFGRDLFPFIPGHRELRIDKMALLFNTGERPDCDGCSGECGCGEDNRRGCWCVGFKSLRGECDEAGFCCAASEDWPDLYHGVIDTSLGPLGRSGDRQQARLRFPAEVGAISEAFLLCHFEVASRCPDK